MRQGYIIQLGSPARGTSRYLGILGRLLLVLSLLMPTSLAYSFGLLDKLDEAVEEHYEKLAQDAIEDDVEEQVEDAVEEAIEDNIADNVDNSVEEEIADSIEDGIGDAIDDQLEEDIAGAVEEAVEERIADTLEEDVEELIADTVEESIEEEIAASVEEDINEGIEAYAEQSVEEDIEDNVLDSVIDSIIESTEDQLEARINQPERHLSKHEWLVMAEEGALQVLAENGYIFDRVTHLEGLGLQLAEVSAPASFDISEVRAGVLDVVGSDFAQVDVNHLYTAGVSLPSKVEGYAPQEAMDFPADTQALPMKIGMIDTAVDLEHRAFEQAHIQSRHFGSRADKTPQLHGTAIASLISANSADFSGIAPQSSLYAASVFEIDRERGEVASTASLVKALDWLTREQVEVINMSLAGPPNRLLQAVLSRVSQKGIPVLAAAGNAGPASEPLYPAAYDSVVAITAVEADGRVFRLANRGDYLDLSAPGVNIRHAQAGGGYQVSSGTSFAVPFASVAVARLRAQQPGGDVLAQLYRSAKDLGPPGKDNIYGYGLLNPVAPSQLAANYQR